MDAVHGPTQHAAGMTVSYDAQIQPAFTGCEHSRRDPLQPHQTHSFGYGLAVQSDPVAASKLRSNPWGAVDALGIVEDLPDLVVNLCHVGLTLVVAGCLLVLGMGPLVVAGPGDF